MDLATLQVVLVYVAFIICHVREELWLNIKRTWLHRSLKLLLERFYHLSGKCLSLIPDIDQFPYFLLYNHIGKYGMAYDTLQLVGEGAVTASTRVH